MCVSSAQQLRTRDGSATVSFVTVGLPQSSLYLLLDGPTAKSYLQDPRFKDASDLPLDSDERQIVLSFKSEDDFCKFSKEFGVKRERPAAQADMFRRLQVAALRALLPSAHFLIPACSSRTLGSSLQLCAYPRFRTCPVRHSDGRQEFADPFPFQQTRHRGCAWTWTCRMSRNGWT